MHNTDPSLGTAKEDRLHLLNDLLCFIGWKNKILVSSAIGYSGSISVAITATLGSTSII